METRKQAVSIRMNANDIRNVKRLAKRLGARDSDIIRYAVKSMLARLAPLGDPAMRGQELVPMLAESGVDLCRHFDLDSSQLESIVNDNAESSRRIDRDDIQLIAMSYMQRSYVEMRLAGALKTQVIGAVSEGNDERKLDRSLRQYLYDKYGISSGSGYTPHAHANGVERL